MIDLHDKTVTIMGLGLLGRGVNISKYFLEKGVKRLIITDLKSADQLAESIKILGPYEDRITYVLERHRVKDFIETDFVIKAAGVPINDKYIYAARKNDVPVKMDASWAMNLLPSNVLTIGVTGSKGKSSVTHLINHILETDKRTVYMGGNVRGQATLPILDEIKSGDILLLELDSWQLQGFHDEQISPNVAVFTNLLPDHMNYYNGMKDYYYDKSAVYKYQNKCDYLVLSSSSYEAMRMYDDAKPVAKTAIVKSSILMKDWEFTQVGEHNRLNAAQAYQVAKFLNIEDKVIKDALATFPGVSGRLQLIAEYEGVKYFNDNNATIPEATAASIKAIATNHGKPTIICGGVSKKFPSLSVLKESLNKYCAGVVFLPGGIGESIIDDLKIKSTMTSSMQEAVSEAYKMLKITDSKVLMMSPAGASFGLFVNEYDRSDQFEKSIKDLIDSNKC